MAGDASTGDVIDLPFDVPETWGNPRLSSHCELMRDGDWIESKDQSGDDYRLLQISNIGVGRFVETGNYRWITDETFRRLNCTEILAGDVLVARMPEPTGRAWYVRALPWRSVTAVDVAIIRTKRQELDPRFLGYFLNSPACLGVVKSLTTGTTRLRIRRGDIERLQIPLPPLPEQRAIAHILGTLDDKIELNRRMSETLEAMAGALFKSWFVDFDPVRAKAEGRDPGLPPPLADLFPDRLVDSELGEIPEGWGIEKLSDLCSTQYGYTAGAVDEPVGPKFLRVTDINKRNWIEWADVPHCEIDSDAKQTYGLKIGDLVVARMADPGKSAIIEDDIDAVFASYLVRLKTRSPAHSYYVYGFLKSDLYAEYAEGAKSGSVQANMNARVIVGASLVVPPAKVMEQFLRAILPFRQRLVSNVRQSRTLAALRDALLPRLISGEIRVAEAARVARDANR